jgi:hypothetical protein
VLLTAAIAHEEDRFRVQVAERLEGKAAAERMAILIDASCGGGDWLLWIELWTRALHDEEAARVRRELDERWRGEIVATVEEGQGSGAFAGVDAPAFAAQLAAFIDGLAVQVALEDPEMPIERMSELARGMAELHLKCSLPPPTAFGYDLLEAAA